MENIKKSKQEARLDALDKFETIVLGAKSMKEILTSYAQIHNDYMKIGVSNDEYKVAYLEELYKLFSSHIVFELMKENGYEYEVESGCAQWVTKQ